MFMSEKASINKCFLSSRPIAVALNITWIRVLSLAIAVCFLCLEIRTLYLISNMGLARFQHYRFTPLRRRDGRAPLSPGIQDIGIMMRERGGAAVTCSARNDKMMHTHAVNNASLIVSYHPVSGCAACPDTNGDHLSGWYFRTHATQPADEDPVGYVTSPGSVPTCLYTVLAVCLRAFLHLPMFCIHKCTQYVVYARVCVPTFS